MPSGSRTPPYSDGVLTRCRRHTRQRVGRVERVRPATALPRPATSNLGRIRSGTSRQVEPYQPRGPVERSLACRSTAARDEWLATAGEDRTARSWRVEPVAAVLAVHPYCHPPTTRLHYTRDIERVLIPYLGRL
jgi:hypothetical protein